MKTEVIIEDYLSREEIQDIVKDELRILVKDSFGNTKIVKPIFICNKQ